MYWINNKKCTGTSDENHYAPNKTTENCVQNCKLNYNIKLKCGSVPLTRHSAGISLSSYLSSVTCLTRRAAIKSSIIEGVNIGIMKNKIFITKCFTTLNNLHYTSSTVYRHSTSDIPVVEI